jgi:hypothetical protein
MDAFATSDQLAVAMKRTFTDDEAAWVTLLLVQAAGIMRGLMHSQVYPSQQSTYRVYPVAGRVNLPQGFIRSIDSVQRESVDVRWERFEDAILVRGNWPLDVTISWGLDEAPDDLVSINCALVSGSMMTVEAGIGLTAGGLSSIALDDFKAAWADGGASSGMTPSAFTISYLQNTYGTTSWMVHSA